VDSSFAAELNCCLPSELNRVTLCVFSAWRKVRCEPLLGYWLQDAKDDCRIDESERAVGASRNGHEKGRWWGRSDPSEEQPSRPFCSAHHRSCIWRGSPLFSPAADRRSSGLERPRSRVSPARSRGEGGRGISHP
jgi:hypothetical protein